MKNAHPHTHSEGQNDFGGKQDSPEAMPQKAVVVRLKQEPSF